jgi:Diphosphoinositol pentakisphosphate kinase 2 N-terminal domain
MPRASRASLALSRLSASAEVRRRREQASTTAGGDALRVRLGVCAMEKKANSKPMLAILKRMNTLDEFEIVNFGDNVRRQSSTPVPQIALAFRIAQACPITLLPQLLHRMPTTVQPPPSASGSRACR